MKPLNMITNLIFELYKIVYEAVFPSKCLVCNSFMHAPDSNCSRFTGKFYNKTHTPPLAFQIQLESLLADCLCHDCIKGLAAVESPLCKSCGLPFNSRQGEDHHCGDCITSPRKFRIARAALVYDKISTEVIHCFKYKGKTQLARPLSELLMMTLRNYWDDNSINVILPVPLHIKRLMKRGFNQAHLLIRDWHLKAKQNEIDLQDCKIESDVLVRTTPTVAQTALSRSQRAINVRNAFILKSKEKIVNQNVLLVDDVYTTGATVNECAGVLLEHGAKRVDVLTLARAI